MMRGSRRRRAYFLKQKIMGVIVLIISVILAVVLDGDITTAVVTVPLGIGLIVSKEMLIVDSYYIQTKEMWK